MRHIHILQCSVYCASAARHSVNKHSENENSAGQPNGGGRTTVVYADFNVYTKDCCCSYRGIDVSGTMLAGTDFEIVNYVQ